MSESKREGAQTAAAEAERPSDNTRDGTQHRPAGFAQESVRQAGDASAAAASSAVRSGSAIAECAQEITTAWTHYAEDVMRHTSEASGAMLRARTFNEMVEVQAKLMRDNMQAFLDHSVKIAEAAGRMATRPLAGLSEGASDPVRRQ